MKHIAQGISDFLKRYTANFRHVWAERHALDGPELTQDEIEFLPAHLELTETPVSPAARWTMRLIAILFAIALVWSIVGKVDIVAVAPGKTVASGRTKVIQPLEAAVVKRILVQDGQEVKAGQLLVELDGTAAGADVAKASDALLTAKLTASRLDAIAKALDHGGSPKLEQDERLPKDRIKAEQDLATSQYAAYLAKRDNLGASIQQRKAEIGTIETTVSPMAQTAEIARTRENDYAKLLEGKYVGRHDYLMRQQERIAAERDLAAQKSRLQETRAALAGAQDQLHVLVTDFRQQTLDGLRQAREQMQQYAPELAKSGQRNDEMTLESPVDGTVQQLAVHTIGGVVTPAQQLMAVVPKGDGLEVEATVLNKDIGFVKAGQRAMVKVESFPYTRYGYLEGEVVSVSHDAAQDEKLGLVFPARVRLKQNTLDVDGAQVRLTPGMALSVEIQTGSRRLISYVLSPLQSHMYEAGRER